MPNYLRIISVFTLSIVTLLAILTSPYWGWDSSYYCGLTQIALNGGNPYSIAEAERLNGVPWPLVYPPLVLPVLELLCGTTWKFFHLLALLSLAAVYFLISNRGAYESALLLGAFTGALEMVASGNLVLIELVIIAVVLLNPLSIYAGVLIGVATFTKIQPAAIAVAIALWTGRPLRFLLVTLLTYLGLSALTWISYPQESSYYIAALTGFHDPKWSAVVIEDNQPSLLNLARYLTRVLGIENAGYPLFALLSVGGAAVAYLLSSRRTSNPKSLWLALILLVACLPRLASYTYIMTTVPIILMSRSLSATRRMLLLLVSATIPLCCFYIFRLTDLATAQGDFFQFVKQFYPLLSLLSVVALLCLWSRELFDDLLKPVRS